MRKCIASFALDFFDCSSCLYYAASVDVWYQRCFNGMRELKVAIKKCVVNDSMLYSQVRRAHLNDLENVIPFVLLSLLYVGTNPDPIVAFQGE